MPEARALQPKRNPQCPLCLRAFDLTLPANQSDKYVVSENRTSMRRDLITNKPDRFIPVRCACGWEGEARFLEGTD